MANTYTWNFTFDVCNQPENGHDDITKDWAKAKTLGSLGKTEDEMQTLLDDQMTALANPPMRQAVPSGW